ncbi:MAG TPA: endolytic transglycosylase MltG, partial [Microbacteriaceae bacterium]
ADYPGPGGPEVEITIPSGATGADVARLLLEADVVESFDAVYDPMLDLDPTIFPGTYSFPTQIPGLRAVEILIAGNNRVYEELRLREGLTIDQTLEQIEIQLGIPVEEMTESLSDLEALGIDNPADSADGYLFPATYKLDPGTDSDELVQIILARLDEELAKHGLTRSEAHDLLTLASIIQLEARLEPDFYKVSTVFNNRLDIDMPLQSDATVNYGTKGEKVTTTDEQRADPNPYNTYFYRGLPIGPIGNPGGLAIDSALNPAQGDWLYFVSINLATGETVFSETLAEHERAVLDFQSWIRANPSWNE